MVRINNKELYRITITYSVVGKDTKDKLINWYNRQTKHISLKVVRL